MPATFVEPQLLQRDPMLNQNFWGMAPIIRTLWMPTLQYPTKYYWPASGVLQKKYVQLLFDLLPRKLKTCLGVGVRFQEPSAFLVVHGFHEGVPHVRHQQAEAEERVRLASMNRKPSVCIHCGTSRLPSEVRTPHLQEWRITSGLRVVVFSRRPHASKLNGEPL